MPLFILQGKSLTHHASVPLYSIALSKDFKKINIEFWDCLSCNKWPLHYSVDALIRHWKMLFRLQILKGNLLTLRKVHGSNILDTQTCYVHVSDHKSHTHSGSFMVTVRLTLYNEE